MNEISEMIKQTIEKIMGDLCSKEIVEAAEDGKFPTELWETLVESGMMTIGISEERGGSGGSVEDTLTMLKIAGKFSAPIPLAETILANWLLSEVGLPLIEKPMTIASNHNRKDLQFIETADGWFISGVVADVPWARFADKIIVEGMSNRGNMVAIIDSSACQMEYSQNLAGEPRDTLYFNNLFVKKVDVSILENIKENTNLYRGALIRAVQMTGALEKILELTITYSKERIQFGRQIAKFQAVQQQLAILTGEVSAANAITDLAIKSFETGDGEKQIMAAKIRVGEAVSTGVPIAHQVHGAIGFTDEHSLHQSTKRLWSWRDEFGHENFWANKFGAEVLHIGADDVWSYVTSMKKNFV